MSYVYDKPESLEGLPIVGSGQCVALVKEYAGAPASSMWRAGAAVRGDMMLKKGTAIATFVDGRYPNNGTGNHAALYVSQDAVGIWVVDQWSRSGKIQYRHLRFQGRVKDAKGKETTRYVDPSNNGDAFSVIE